MGIKYDCPINEITSYCTRTTLLLIKYGNLNCLKYVVNHGCLWNKVEGLETAIFYDQQHIINWINEN